MERNGTDERIIEQEKNGLRSEHQIESAEPALFGKDKFDKISGLI